MAVPPRPVAARQPDRESEQERRGALSAARRPAAIAAVALVALAACVTGVGLLYLVRQGGLLGFGPRVRHALPLQQLSGTDAQPLPRMALAWIAAGFGAGVATARLESLTAPIRAAALAAFAYAFLVIAGSASDALTANERFRDHFGSQFGSAGIWVSLTLMLIGWVIGERLWRGPARAASAG